MSALDVIFNTISFVLSIAGILGMVGLVPSVIAGIVFLAKRSNEADPEKKKSLLKKGLIFLFLPGILIIGSLILYAVINVIKTLLIAE